jgi:hypothetical protein
MVECGGGSCQMIAAQVCEGNRSGQPDSRAAELARRPRPLDAQDRTGALAYPRGAPPGRDPVSSLRAGASGPAGGGCGRASAPSAAVRRACLARDAAHTVARPLLRGPSDDAATVRAIRAAQPPHASLRAVGLAAGEHLHHHGRRPHAGALGGTPRRHPRPRGRARRRLERLGAAGCARPITCGKT